MINLQCWEELTHPSSSQLYFCCCAPNMEVKLLSLICGPCFLRASFIKPLQCIKSSLWCANINFFSLNFFLLVWWKGLLIVLFPRTTHLCPWRRGTVLWWWSILPMNMMQWPSKGLIPDLLIFDPANLSDCLQSKHLDWVSKLKMGQRILYYGIVYLVKVTKRGYNWTMYNRLAWILL